MSLESAKAFMERMKNDEDFRKKVTECKNVETRMALVRQDGFEFTEEDIKALKSELTDGDLQNIAAGTTGYCFIFNTGQHPW